MLSALSARPPQMRASAPSSALFADQDAMLDKLVANQDYYRKPEGHDKLLTAYARARQAVEELPGKVPYDYQETVASMVSVGLDAGTYAAAKALIPISATPAPAGFVDPFPKHDDNVKYIADHKAAYGNPVNHEKLAVASAQLRSACENLVTTVPYSYRDIAMNCVSAAMNVAICQTALALLPLQG